MAVKNRATNFTRNPPRGVAPVALNSTFRVLRMTQLILYCFFFSFFFIKNDYFVLQVTKYTNRKENTYPWSALSENTWTCPRANLQSCVLKNHRRTSVKFNLRDRKISEDCNYSYICQLNSRYGWNGSSLYLCCVLSMPEQNDRVRYPLVLVAITHNEG